MNIRLSALLFLLCILNICSAVSAQSLNTASLDSLFTALESNNKSMGAITISRDGQQLYNRHFGYREIKATGMVKPDNDTKYRIGSISKTFTAVIVLKLIENGLLKADTRLSVFYPSIPNGDKITIERLLTHRSGLARQEDAKADRKLTHAKSVDDFIAILAGCDQHLEDTLNGHYSNVNYMVLGHIIEKVTNSTYDEQLKQIITAPLGLRNTYNVQRLLDASRDEAHSFRLKDNKWVEDFEFPVALTDASGFIVSTTQDLNVFIEALFNGRILSEGTVRKMMDIKGRYGMGLMPIPFYERKAFGHSGRLEGFVSNTAYFPADKTSVSLILNGQVFPMNDILIATLSIVYNTPFEPFSYENIKLSQSQVTPLLGTYEGQELGMKTFVKIKNGDLFVQMKRKGGLLKQVLSFKALSPVRFINESQGIIIDFDKPAAGNTNYQSFTMRIGAAKIHFKKES